MLDRVLRTFLTPFRFGVVRWRRGNPIRSACVAVLKPFERRSGSLRGLQQIVPLDRPDVSFEASDSMVMRSVYWFGVQGYEGTLPDVWADLCRQAKSVLEIGGNVGLYAVTGARAGSCVYTVVEPVPEIASVLRANLARNGLQSVQVLQAAVIPGIERNTVELNIPDEGSANPVGAHLVVGSEVRGRSSQRIVKVDGLPFRELLEGRDLVKIDAEGLEYSLLAEAEEQLRQFRPTLIVEVLPESVQLAAFLCKIAREADYVIHVVPAYGSQTIVTVAPDKFDSSVPRQHRSKDVILSRHPLPGTAVHLS